MVTCQVAHTFDPRYTRELASGSRIDRSSTNLEWSVDMWISIRAVSKRRSGVVHVVDEAPECNMYRHALTSCSQCNNWASWTFNIFIHSLIGGRISRRIQELEVEPPSAYFFLFARARESDTVWMRFEAILLLSRFLVAFVAERRGDVRQRGQ